MGMKFLNKKGWHTGSIRNIENVWKAEQKHEQEQRKLEELRKNIQEERDRDEFRQLQVQAGITPAQERLEFLYDSGLAVGKKSDEGFAALPSVPALNDNLSASAAAPAATSSSLDTSTPGALFEDKPQSANDAWRKLHSDPLLMIRQREQEALARIKNNPVKMAMIRKSVEMKKKDDESQDGKHKKGKKKHKKHSSSKRHLDSDNNSDDDREWKRKAKNKMEKHLHLDDDLRNKTKRPSYSDSDEDFRDQARHQRRSDRDHDSDKRQDGSPARQKPKSDRGHVDPDEDSREGRNHRHSRRDHGGERHRGRSPLEPKLDRTENRRHLHSGEDSGDGRNHHRDYRRDTVDHDRSQRGDEKRPLDSYTDKCVRKSDNGNSNQGRDRKPTTAPPKYDSFRRRGKAPQLTEEERAAKLREMQMDAELHEQQRWKRLKKADEADAREASTSTITLGKSFLDDVQKSVYGTEKGGSSTIEESVRRRSHFLQGRSGDDERNAFRR